MDRENWICLRGVLGAKTHGASGNRAHYGFDDVDNVGDKTHSDISLAGHRSAPLHYLAGQMAVSSKKAPSGSLFYSSCHHNTEWF